MVSRLRDFSKLVSLIARAIVRSRTRAVVSCWRRAARLRALLGRTCLSEGRAPVAAVEFDFARSLDPRSPTAWFYEALLKQRANRPVEAAADYEHAIALNDQRAVLRPGSLLDVGRAARAAALAGVWRHLGFDAALLSTARAALLEDPAKRGRYTACTWMSNSGRAGRPAPASTTKRRRWIPPSAVFNQPVGTRTWQLPLRLARFEPSGLVGLR